MQEKHIRVAFIFMKKTESVYKTVFISIVFFNTFGIILKQTIGKNT